MQLLRPFEGFLTRQEQQASKTICEGSIAASRPAAGLFPFCGYYRHVQLVNGGEFRQ
jgi:hypothetical protein